VLAINKWKTIGHRKENASFQTIDKKVEPDLLDKMQQFYQ